MNRTTPPPHLGAGDQFHAVLVENLSRAHIAQYAGAAGDFNLVHVDEQFAAGEAGRDTVIAHGMLTMGLTASCVTSILGSAALRSFGGRFLAPVGPGDTLECTVTVEADPGDDTDHDVTLAVQTRTSTGITVFTGTAKASIPAR